MSKKVFAVLIIETTGVLEALRIFKARKTIEKKEKVIVKEMWVSLLALFDLAELQKLLIGFFQYWMSSAINVVI